MRLQRNTKIIATLSSASVTGFDIRNLVAAGVDVFHMDMAYGAHSDHRNWHKELRALESETGRAIGVVMDLKGPTFPIGSFRSVQVELVTGQCFSFDMSPGLGDHGRVHLPYPEIYTAVKEGDLLFLDSGKIQLQVEVATRQSIVTRVQAGGFTRDKDELRAPNVYLPVATLTDKDAVDLAFGLSLGIDWVALSFVQNADDIHALRTRLGSQDRPRIIAKLGKRAALQHLQQIVEAADAVMICREELGIELEPEDVPIAQRRILDEGLSQGKPVIIATHMLATMAHQLEPGHAEVNDAATAVYAGADAVLLSAETVNGKYGTEAVRTMDRLARRIERDDGYLHRLNAYACVPKGHGGAEAISAAVRATSERLPLLFSAAFTASGSTCLAVARLRPRSPILALSPSLSTVRMLTLVWGVNAIQICNVESVEQMLGTVLDAARKLGYHEEGRPFAIVAGMPFGTPGSTNLLRIDRM